MKKKMDERTFQAIKEYARSHSNGDTARHFGVSVGTVGGAKRFPNIKAWREYLAEISRKSFQRRKAVIKEAVKGDFRFVPPKEPIDGTGAKPENKTAMGDPFGDAVKPQPITPIGANRAPEQDGRVTVSKTAPAETLPITPEQYRKAYQEKCVELGTANGKLAKAAMDYKDLEDRYNGLKRLYDNIRVSCQEKTQLVEKLQNELASMKQVIPKDGAPTEIEITVGDATIKVSTKGK